MLISLIYRSIRHLSIFWSPSTLFINTIYSRSILTVCDSEQVCVLLRIHISVQYLQGLAPCLFYVTCLTYSIMHPICFRDDLFRSCLNFSCRWHIKKGFFQVSYLHEQMYPDHKFSRGFNLSSTSSFTQYMNKTIYLELQLRLKYAWSSVSHWHVEWPSALQWDA